MQTQLQSTQEIACGVGSAVKKIAADSSMAFELAFFRGNVPHGFAIISDTPITVGRSDNSDVKLESRTVSRHHCELKIKRGRLTIKDLGSRNGILINGKLAESGVRLIVSENDVIQIGKYLLRTKETSADKKPEAIDIKTRHDETDNLLASLEALIRNQVGHDDLVSHPTSFASDKDTKSALESWQDNDRDDESGKTESPGGNTTQIEPQDTSGTTIFFINDHSAADQETPVEDEAELRRLELRKRLDSLKAKDSKEAADRALKKLFGG